MVTTLDPDATERRDGLHGLAAWALAVVLGTVLAALVGSAALTRSNSPNVTPARTSAAEPLLSLELDRLFRPVRRPANVDLAEARAEAGRILLTASSHTGMTTEDRAYLIQLVTNTTGLAGPDAERRADATIVNAKTAIARSRRSGVIVSFSRRCCVVDRSSGVLGGSVCRRPSPRRRADAGLDEYRDDSENPRATVNSSRRRSFASKDHVATAWPCRAVAMALRSTRDRASTEYGLCTSSKP